MSLGRFDEEFHRLQLELTRRFERSEHRRHHPTPRGREVEALLDADRNASLAECPPPHAPDAGLTPEQAMAMDDTTTFLQGDFA